MSCAGRLNVPGLIREKCAQGAFVPRICLYRDPRELNDLIIFARQRNWLQEDASGNVTVVIS